jgi:transglutaminase-like putative cysteine protease
VSEQRPDDHARSYQVRHSTEYTYGADVTASYGWAYLTPRDLPEQVCRSSRVEVEPVAAMISDAVDFFGNRASYFEVHEPHGRLVVTSTSVVDVVRSGADLDRLDAWTWEQARDLLHADPRLQREEADFLLASPRLPLAGQLPEFAGRVLEPGLPLGQTLRRLVGTIYQDFTFRSGATSVTSTLEDLFTRRAGVCQDFAHLAVATLRLAGLPARYVSGYLETLPPPGKPKLQGVDASHAWVSVLVPELGWVDLDPTNNKVVDAAYVVTAWGRDYSDVPPLKGVIFTEGGSSTLKVAVDVTRLPAGTGAENVDQSTPD